MDSVEYSNAIKALYKQLYEDIDRIGNEYAMSVNPYKVGDTIDGYKITEIRVLTHDTTKMPILCFNVVSTGKKKESKTILKKISEIT